MPTLSELLTDEERSAIRAPIEEAKTLPRRTFIDANFYEFEVDHVLKESWLAISFSAKIANSGDLLPTNGLGTPILLIRGKDGVARAFHNVCPYDSCEVSIQAQRDVEHIITPYHGWQYDLEGRLIAANYWDGTQDSKSIDPSDLNANLLPISCEEWMGTIFVYLGKHPAPFAEQNHAVISHLKDIDLSRLKIGLGKDKEPLVHSLSIKSNWKTVYENYSPNVYHESFVHEMYRKSPHSPRVENGEKTYTEINDPSGYLGLCYDNKIGSSIYGESRLPEIRNKDGSANTINTISNVFPNWVTTVLGDTVRISVFLPTGVNEGTQIVATFFDQEAATAPNLEKDRIQAARKGIQARVEDNLICESIQRARHSPALHSQFYSPFWDAMHYTLSTLILDKLEQSEKP
jgi:choline monooxygenase